MYYTYPDLSVADCQDGDIQLSGGTANTQGTVQYCFYNTWGLISDNSWDDNAASVVCSQLGHTGIIMTIMIIIIFIDS